MQSKTEAQLKGLYQLRPLTYRHEFTLLIHFTFGVKGLLHLPKIEPLYIKNNQANPAQMRECNSKVTQRITFHEN